MSATLGRRSAVREKKLLPEPFWGQKKAAELHWWNSALRLLLALCHRPDIRWRMADVLGRFNVCDVSRRPYGV